MFDVILSFFIFLIIQSLVINGVYEAFSGKMVKYQEGYKPEGNILYPVRRIIEKYVSEYWQKPLFGCIKCMSSVWGSLTFWGTVLPVFGFAYFQIWVWVLDIFALVTLNWIIYKKL